MHFLGVLLFGAVVLLDTSNAHLRPHPLASGSLDSNRNLFAHPDEAQSDQRVKDGDLGNEDDEDERINISEGLSWIKNLKQPLRPKVTLGKLDSWIDQKKSPDHVFERFGLHKPNTQLFDSPDFKLWVAYTKMVVEMEPDHMAAVLTTLKKYYSEDELVAMLVKAEKTELREKIFAQLHTEWLAQEEPLRDVFTTFGLHKVNGNDLKHGLFARWLKYADEYLKAQGNKHESIARVDPAVTILSALRGCLRQDALVRMLAAAEKTDTTDGIFSVLYSEWLKRDVSPLGVVGIFGLHKTKGNDLEPGLLARWASYVDKYFDIEGEAKYKSYNIKEMVSALLMYYPTDKLVNMLGTAKRTEEADSIFSALYGKWAADEKASLDVYMSFGLHKTQSIESQRAWFARWLSYIEAQSKEQGNSGLIMLPAVTGHISYSDLTQLLKEGKTEAAQVLKGILPFFWKGKDPGDVFKVASLKEDGELLASAEFQTWLKVIDKHNKVNPKQATSVVETMDYFFGEEKLTTILIAASKQPESANLARDLMAKQLEQWLGKARKSFADDRYTPASVFAKLQLDKDENLLTNPLFSLWVKYADDERRRVSLMSVLLTYYSDDALAKMIFEAKKIKGGELAAKRLEAELFKHWMITSIQNGEDHRLFVLNALKIDENGLPSDLLSIYKDFAAFSEKTMNLRKDASGTTSIEVAQKLKDSIEMNKKLKAAKTEEEMSMKTKKSWLKFLKRRRIIKDKAA
uniref:Uncharacterized protein n=1 Tax=Peronospora matthiolae TaxID=2874970 RepID=A0AAV1UWN3_9STRA